MSTGPFTPLTCLLLATLLHSCSGNDQLSGLDTRVVEIVPLAQGNSWIFEYASFDSLGNLSSVDTLRYIVDGELVVDGQQWYQVTLWFYPSAEANRYIQGRFFWRNAADGLYSGPIFPVLVYKYPAETGDTYGEDPVIYEVISTRDTLQVPAGTIVCYHYEYTFGGIVAQSYVSPGIGWVLGEDVAAASSERMYLAGRRRLISYHIN